MKRRAFIVLLLMGGVAEALPPPADTAAAGVVRVSASAALRPLFVRWQTGFRKLNPDVKIEFTVAGSDVAMAGLYTRRTDVALLGREAAAAELKAYEWIYRCKPASVEVARGSLDRAGASPALVFFVHRDNPLAGLTLAQADALFGTERLRGAPAAIRTWGQLGLRDEWADRVVNLYAPDTESGTGRFLRAAVLGDSRKLDWSRLTEFADTRPLGDPTHDAAHRILAALARDRLGLAIASFAGANPLVKPLVLDGVAATSGTLVARRYPLTRGVLAYFHRLPAGRRARRRANSCATCSAPPASARSPRRRHFCRSPPRPRSNCA